MYVEPINRLLLVKCYDNKMVKSPDNWVIRSSTQPQVANQQKNEMYIQQREVKITIFIEFEIMKVRVKFNSMNFHPFYNLITQKIKV